MQATERRERPILFSGEMVRAILDGRKSQFREVVKPQPDDDDIYFTSEHVKSQDYMAVDGEVKRGGILHICGNVPDPEPSFVLTCPYGKPGDLLWVRETWRLGRINGASIPNAEFATIQFKAGWGVLPYRRDWREFYVDLLGSESSWESSETGNLWGRWRPSIHMPRWASRITLEVTDVRVERVQSISESDALADGGWVYRDCPIHKAPERSFSQLWDSLNAKRGYSWDSNPYVWVVEFKRKGEIPGQTNASKMGSNRDLTATEGHDPNAMP